MIVISFIEKIRTWQYIIFKNRQIWLNICYLIVDITIKQGSKIKFWQKK
jgi:hypothetical protein